MDIFVSLIFTTVFVALSSQQQQDMRLARRGNDFMASAGNTDIAQDTNCYDRCYDAYITGRDVIGCACSQYDFNGRNSLQNCNCPVGSICQQSLGKRNCVPRSEVGGQMIGGGRYGSATVSDGRPASSGQSPGQNVCGVPPLNCIAKNNRLNVVSKFTYDPRIQACLKTLVYASCTSVKLFDSQPECLRICSDQNKGY